MRYLSAQQLRSYNSRYFNPLNESLNRKYRATTKIFLSHSHKHADLIIPAIAYFLSQGIEIYVDWLDKSMPTATSGVTATKIKEKIRENHKLVVLLTANSRDSKWVPWELGYADGIKGIDNVAILPIKRSSTDSFSGIEYMSIYRKIGFDGVGYNTRSVIAKDITTRYPKSLNEGFLRKSIY